MIHLYDKKIMPIQIMGCVNFVIHSWIRFGPPSPKKNYHSLKTKREKTWDYSLLIRSLTHKIVLDGHYLLHSILGEVDVRIIVTSLVEQLLLLFHFPLNFEYSFFNTEPDCRNVASNCRT